jgi:hypothetical protein
VLASPTGSRRAVRALIVVGLLTVLLIVGFRWWRTSALETALRRFEEVTAPLIARGEPLGVFDRESAETFADNGAPALLEALDALTFSAGDPSRWPDGPWDLEEDELAAMGELHRAELRRFVTSQADVLVRIAAAASAADLAFPPRRDAGEMIEWAPVMTLLDLGHLLRARALVGETEAERVAALETWLRLGRRWRPRTALEALVAVTLLRNAAAETGEALADGRIGAQAARERLAPLLAEDVLAIYPELVRAERTWLLSLHDGLVDLPGVDDDSDERMLSVEGYERGPGSMSLAGPHVVDAATEAVLVHEEIVSVLSADHLAVQAAVGEIVDAAQPTEDSFLPWLRVRELLGGTSAIVYENAVRELTEVDARLRLTRLALAAVEVRDRTGAWPPSLAALGDAMHGVVPANPRTGEAFAYELRGDGSLRIAAPPPAREQGGDEDDLEWIAPR